MAASTLALLNQQADEVSAELVALRREAAQLKRDRAASPAAVLLEANEQLVLAALREQGSADEARRQLRKWTRAAQEGRPPPVSPSGEEARAEYLMRVQDLRQANEKLVIAALSSRETEENAEQSHSKQISFLAMAAHELRNPLLPLRLAAQMLTRPRTPEELAKLQGIIDSQVGHMARLIGDLLDGSRVSTGKFTLKRDIIDLTVVLRQAIETCQPAMEARHHQFTHSVPEGPLPIYGDSVRLVQVFSNLLENAAKYTPEGGEIALETALAGDTLTVTVSDDGIGITEGALPHVFELFVQDEHATLHNQGGLGIGLAVVGELVAAHGGTVVATSAGKDLGSRFVVTLPIAAAVPESAQQAH